MSKLAIPTKTVQRIIKEVTGMMVSHELAEYEAEVLVAFLTARAMKIKDFAEDKNKKILKKEMAKKIEQFNPLFKLVLV